MRTTRATVMMFALAAGALGGCAGPRAASPAAETPAPAPAQIASAEDPGDPTICKEEGDSTTRVRKHKTCLKKSEWEARADSARRGFEQSQGPMTNPESGGQ
ncbi:MAG: hypothetical protein JNL56_14470 [Alphaproteobacteria bacterium]|nr:hypothetical protein [Alphaproteobacteria bacterium]